MDHLTQRRLVLPVIPVIALIAALLLHGHLTTVWHPRGTGGFRLVSTQFLAPSPSFRSASVSTAIAVTPDGGTVLAGTTYSKTFPVQSAFQASAQSRWPDSSGFITSLRQRGGIRFSTYFGGPGITPRGVAVDPAGNIYLTGIAASSHLPTRHAFQARRSAGSCSWCGDAFLAKLNLAGQLIYSTYLGGSMNDGGMAVAADAAGDAYVTGYTTSDDFPIRHAVQRQYAGPDFDKSDAHYSASDPGGDAFLAVFGPSGALLSSTYLGGARDDVGTGIAVDRRGRIVVVGNTVSSAFPYGPTSHSSNDYPDVFITEMDPQREHSHTIRFGGENGATVSGIALGRNGTMYIAGATVSHHLPTRNAVQPDYAGGSCIVGDETVDCTDAFVAGLRPRGRLVFSTYLGGSGNDGGYPYGTDLAVGGIGVAPSGTVYIASVTDSHDFPTSGTFWPQRWSCNAHSNPCTHAFLAAFAPTGHLIAITDVGATGDGTVFLAVNKQGHALVTGDIPPPSVGSTAKVGRSTASGSAMFVLEAMTERTART
ncbi:MAG TPA: SBBP repeat-containing protein [Chloroflexota bacterium]